MSIVCDVKGVKHFSVDNLNEKSYTELKKLEKASQDFEAIFVKGLLSQMRKVSFSEESGAMGDMAKDMMDQAVAESVSKSGSSIGIAKTIFMDMAMKTVKSIQPTGDQSE